MKSLAILVDLVTLPFSQIGRNQIKERIMSGMWWNTKHTRNQKTQKHFKVLITETDVCDLLNRNKGWETQKKY